MELKRSSRIHLNPQVTASSLTPGVGQITHPLLPWCPQLNKSLKGSKQYARQPGLEDWDLMLEDPTDQDEFSPSERLRAEWGGDTPSLQLRRV